jgi:hypothetical protein
MKNPQLCSNLWPAKNKLQKKALLSQNLQNQNPLVLIPLESKSSCFDPSGIKILFAIPAKSESSSQSLWDATPDAPSDYLLGQPPKEQVSHQICAHGLSKFFLWPIFWRISEEEMNKFQAKPLHIFPGLPSINTSTNAGGAWGDQNLRRWATPAQLSWQQ